MKLYGRNPVLERLKSNPKTIRKIYIQQSHPDQGYIQKKARRWGIPVVVILKTKMQKMARSINAQGLLIDIEDFEYTPFDEVLEFAKRKKVTLLFLDGLTDPQNLGGIIRSLACLGHFALVLPTHRSVTVTETVLRVACGGDNHIKIALVPNLSRALDEAKEDGFWLAGSVVKDGEDLRQAKIPFPLALVVGSEQKGVRDVIRKKLDLALTIPMGHERLSMNVAHAATILCYEVIKQRKG